MQRPRPGARLPACARRSEARTALQESAEQPGSHRVHSLYALALIDAEGGHYEQAVVTAQQALQAAEEAPRPCSALAPTVALLGLLLSARCVDEDRMPGQPP